MYRTGIGYDSHRFSSGRKLIIGGVTIAFDKGLAGHSDADVLCHSIMDAILGGAGLGDIGRHFPDTDARWKDASSIDMLKQVVDLASVKGYRVVWTDSSIIAEEPKLASHLENMKKAIASAGISADRINLKATTNEGMGFVGRGEGIAAISICTLQKTG
ncbi:2-C-methyl-D-erythritol 2,4-cyclodiphosphate synthase [bacterium BMS3Abin07]|nr:2-C-methyl-D-erythritol 2,4-cyclodiphosphate synthase [bacterium BMS3Abin07]GBE33085.1 2-C-methyl-D-erythritol 2,4-cyclodiphosphate synthase [bacterium BMS3Bbin05]